MSISPWSIFYRVQILLWEICWSLLCSWTPKPFNPWRLFLLRLFGAQIYGQPFVHQRARIEHPWNLCLHNRACLGDRSHAYCLDRIIIQDYATVAQEVYLCTGSHNFNSDSLPLVTAPIVIGERVFIGARAFLLPGVSIGSHSIVGACSVVTRSVPPYLLVAGNPAKPVRKL